MIATTPRPDSSYRYRTGRVTLGTFYLLIGVAFLLDAVGALRVSANEFWPLFLIALGVGMLLRRARRLQVEEDRSAQLAVAEERLRIARDLHDIVAHGVSLMTIQIAGARRAADSRPEASAESLAAAEQTGRQTLSELDNMLAALRGADASIGAAAGPAAIDAGWAAGEQQSWATSASGSEPGVHGSAYAGSAGTGRAPSAASLHPLPRLGDVSELVESVRNAGQTVAFDVLGDPPRVPPSYEVVIYRVVQEALTNAVRYADGASISVSLIYTVDSISVFVDDEGPGAAAPGRPGRGHGLLGMSERLATVGGTLEAGPRQPGPGWRVHASIPIFAVVA